MQDGQPRANKVFNRYVKQRMVCYICGGEKENCWKCKGKGTITVEIVKGGQIDKKLKKKK